MLTVYRSNRAEWLAKLLSQQLRLTPPAPAETIEIIVNNWPTSIWLGDQISIENGINAQIKFPFPGTYLKALVQKILKLDSDISDPWKKNQLVWQVLDKLPELLKEEEFKALKEWLIKQPSPQGELSKREWDLAISIAEAYDDYILYRPELICEWSQISSTELEQSSNIPHQSIWQRKLFRILFKSISLEPFAIQVRKAIKLLRLNKVHASNLPKQLKVFGLSSLAPIQIEFLQALSGLINIEIFLLTPGKDLWHRCSQRRALLANNWNEPHDGSWLLSSPRLEATLGRMGAEFQQLLEGTGEYQIGELREEDIFALPSQISTNASREPTLLEQLQEKLVSDKNTTNLKRNINDNSLIFIECPGETRQIEVIRDQILQLLAKDKTLQPRDILIMTPQIERFAPLIGSIFNDINSTKVELPWRITDRSQQNKPGLIKYIFDLLETPNNKFTTSSLDQFLSNKSIQQQQQLDPDEVLEITDCLQQTGFRWGLDITEKDGDETHSLDWCLDRWLLGLILPSTMGVSIEEIAPFSEGLSVNKINKWWQFLSKLSNQLKEIRKPKTIHKWIEFLKAMLNDSFKDGGNWASEYLSIINALEDWKEVSGDYSLRLSSVVVKDILNEFLMVETGRFGHQSGSLTISALEPMRALPHKVVILMGLDENIFPRHRIKPSFNLLEQNRRLGDPKDSEKDRYIILETIMSTRENLIISWNSRDEKTGDQLQISNPVQQFLDHLLNELGEKSYEGILIQPPANPLDANNFISRLGRDPISCNGVNLEAHKYLKDVKSVKPVALALPVTWNIFEEEHDVKLSTEMIHKWLSEPQLTWLEEYQIKPKEWIESVDESDLLQLTEFQRHKLIKERFARYLISLTDQKPKTKAPETINYWENATSGRGIMPPKSGGILERELLENRWSNLLEKIQRIGLLHSKLIELTDGTYESLWAGEFLVILEIGRLKPSSIMNGWIKHLETCAYQLNHKGTIILSRKTDIEYEESLKWGPMKKEDAKEILQELRSLTAQGLKQCWPVPPLSGWALALAQKTSPEKANKIFEKKWHGEFKYPGENKDPVMEICFGINCDASVFLENKNFKEALLRLYSPIVDNLT